MGSASAFEAAAAFALGAALQGTLLLALAWLADRLLVRRVWPQLLLCLWLLALARCFLPPELSSPLSLTQALGEPLLAATDAAPAPALCAWLAALWAAGALACFGVRFVRRLQIGARIRTCHPSRAWSAAIERAGGRRRTHLGSLAGLETAAVFGLFRPTLLLPREWLEREPTRRDEHALLHEFAHLERRDLWLDELCACARALLWFQPLAWLAAARIHELCELACDEAVARSLGGEARSYRETLVHAARDLVAARPGAGVRAFLGQPNTLVLRIERLESPVARPRALVRGVCAAFALFLVACVLPMADAAADLRKAARHVLAAQRAGERQSCFTVHAAAMVLTANSAPPLRND